MSQDETMRLAASIVDGWTGPLNNMRRDLRKLADDVKGTHTAGAAHAKKHGEAVSGLRKEFQRLDEHVKSTSLQTMAAFGVGAFGVAGAIAAVKDAVFGFGDSTRHLTFLRRETGLSIDQLRQYEALARRVGAAPGAMSKGIKDFAQHMQNIRRMAPEELNALATGMDRNANQFARSLARMSNPEALSGAIGFLDRIPSPQDKRKWLRMLGLPEDLANAPVAELRKQMGEIQKSLGSLAADAEKSALQIEAAMDHLADSIDRLRTDVGTDLAGAFTSATDEIRSFIDENRPALVGTFHEIGDQVKYASGEVKKFIDGLGGLKPFLRGLEVIWAFKNPGTAAGIIASGADPLGVGHGLWDEHIPK